MRIEPLRIVARDPGRSAREIGGPEPRPLLRAQRRRRKAPAVGTRGDRIADRVSAFLGSWRFIVIQTAIVVAWIVSNVLLIVHFDPYPFIFLNLAFSTQAAYAAPLILLASNRAAMRDRLTLEHAAEEADLEELQNERIIEAIQLLDVRLDRIEGRLGTTPG